MGISVVQSCETALSYYYKAAKKGKGSHPGYLREHYNKYVSKC